ncbi:YgfZ/GcvT domain-containing protein [Marinobacter sp.]|uniref:CAF17-like 4Fe-4S cluster assembly/insertion protein YgfZ n=1 Tax=Marinobacter sp. TaxID=50741 RepID=UPI00356A8A85
MTTDTSNIARRHPELPAAALLDDRILFRVSGPGTNDFLQGQLSQNLADVVADHSPRAAASTPKGRAYLLTRLVRDGEDILLTMPASLADDVAAHLNKYLMLFRGTTMERLNNGLIVGLVGEAAAGILAGDDLPLPQGVNDTLVMEDGYLVRTNVTAEGIPRFELWLTEGLDEKLLGKIDRLHQASVTEWEASEIAAGVPELTPETRESWVPQMLNLQHLEGIHFKKGCYTGQEVIARMHFLGQLKKSLYRLGAKSGNQPAPGSPVMAGDKSAGEVVRAVTFDDGSVQLLAVLRHADAEKDLHLPDADQPLQILSLPYTVPEREVAPSDT